jgi:ketosteroid isomerase-like protein
MTASANVNLVRLIAAEWERGDWFGPVMRTHAHPEIEFVRVGEGPDTGVGGRGSWTGAAEARRSWSDYLSAWEDLATTADEYVELDGERVLVLTRIRGQGKTSGLRVDHATAVLFHIRDDKVRRLAIYWDRERALADLGLAPEVG